LFRINVSGIVLLIATGLIVNLLVRPLAPAKEPLWMGVAGILLVVADLFLRMRTKVRSGGGNRWTSGEFGAIIAFPAWILGIAFMALGVARQMKWSE
jgi:hypothetical protein